jgi:hypothetical protein
MGSWLVGWKSLLYTAAGSPGGGQERFEYMYSRSIYVYTAVWWIGCAKGWRSWGIRLWSVVFSVFVQRKGTEKLNRRETARLVVCQVGHAYEARQGIEYREVHSSAHPSVMGGGGESGREISGIYLFGCPIHTIHALPGGTCAAIWVETCQPSVGLHDLEKAPDASIKAARRTLPSDVPSSFAVFRSWSVTPSKWWWCSCRVHTCRMCSRVWNSSPHGQLVSSAGTNLA